MLNSSVITRSETEYDHSFRKGERLKSRKLIQALFDRGAYIRCHPVSVVWLKHALPTEKPVQVGFSVPKKAFKQAVDRNRIKRRLREAYRLNKYRVLNVLEPDAQLALMIIFTGKSLASYRIIESKLIEALGRLSKKV